DFPSVETGGNLRDESQRAGIQTFAIASTFTAEPLADPLKHWMKELGIGSQIEFAPYNQIFQQLLGPSSLLARNRGGLNLILLRVEDWQRSVESESAPR